MATPTPPIHGRGSAENPKNRFVPLSVIPDPDADPDDRPSPQTLFFKDASRSVISTNDSPDVPFTFSLNPYRGCEHGCIYCYARPTHEWLGFSAGIDFETRIMVKTEAPALLRRELSARSWKGDVVSIGGITDPYQPIERKLCLTRQCLQVLSEFCNPCTIVTKNHAVTRDIDILAPMAANDLAAVFVSVTTLDTDLARIMEPRTSSPRRRLDAIRSLAQAKIPVGVMVAPIIPGLTDHELPSILAAAADAGASSAGYVPVRLPYGVKELLESWLERHFPDRKDKVLNRIRQTRSGQLNNSTFGQRMQGHGPFAEHLHQVFNLSCRKLALNDRKLYLRTDLFHRPDPTGQLSLFDSLGS